MAGSGSAEKQRGRKIKHNPKARGCEGVQTPQLPGEQAYQHVRKLHVCPDSLRVLAHGCVGTEEEGCELRVVPRTRVHSRKLCHPAQPTARQVEAPVDLHFLLSLECHLGAIGGRLEVALKRARGTAQRVSVVGRREVVHHPLKQRVHQIELHRDHLRPESQDKEVILACDGPGGGGAVGRVLPPPDPCLEERRIALLLEGRRGGSRLETHEAHECCGGDVMT